VICNELMTHYCMLFPTAPQVPMQVPSLVDLAHFWQDPMRASSGTGRLQCANQADMDSIVCKGICTVWNSGGQRSVARTLLVDTAAPAGKQAGVYRQVLDALPYGLPARNAHR